MIEMKMAMKTNLLTPLTLLCRLSLLISFARASCVDDAIGVGTTLHPSDHLCAGEFRFGVDGLERIRSGDDSWRTVWKTSGSPSRVVFQDDINVVAYSESGRAVWASNTSKSGASKDTAQLVLYNNGNLVLANEERTQVYWELETGAALDWKCIGNRVPSGSRLYESQFICHGDTTFGLEAGALVEHVYYGHVHGWSETFRSDVVPPETNESRYARVQEDGNLVLLRSGSNRPLWSLRSDDLPGAEIAPLYQSFVLKNGPRFASTKTFQNVRASCAGSSELLPGQALFAAERLCSGDRSFGLDDLGDLAYWKSESSTKAWSARIPGSYDTHVKMQHDGNLVVYRQIGNVRRALWSSRTSNPPDFKLKLRMNPEVAIVSQNPRDKKIYWSLNDDSNLFLPSPNCVQSPVKLGQKMYPNDVICSKNGVGKFGLDIDGRLFYSTKNRHSSTIYFYDLAGKRGAVAYFQHDGNFVVYSDEREALYATRTLANSDDDTMDFVCGNEGNCDVKFSDDTLHLDGCRGHTLQAGEELYSEQFLCSNNGKHEFGIDERGNLAYRFLGRNRILVAPDAPPSYANRLRMLVDGNLELVGYNNVNLWRTKIPAEKKGAMMTLNESGRVMIVNGSNRVLLEITNYFS